MSPIPGLPQCGYNTVIFSKILTTDTQQTPHNCHLKWFMGMLWCSLDARPSAIMCDAYWPMITAGSADYARGFVRQPLNKWEGDICFSLFEFVWLAICSCHHVHCFNGFTLACDVINRYHGTPLYSRLAQFWRLVGALTPSTFILFTGRRWHIRHSRPGNNMMTSSNGNIFRVTGPLFGEFTSHRWIPHTKASDAELWCFLWSASE